MKYYMDYKIKNHHEIAELVSQFHKSGKPFAFYFNLINIVRFFSDDKDNLGASAKPTPETKMFVKCQRIRAFERQTPAQQKKRQARLIAHLAKKGIAYKEDKKTCAAKRDFYINVFSFSSQKSFRLSIKNTVVYKPQAGGFDSYGLSKNNTTLPLF